MYWPETSNTDGVHDVDTTDSDYLPDDGSVTTHTAWDVWCGLFERFFLSGLKKIQPILSGQ